jgi:hypothetical protein
LEGRVLGVTDGDTLTLLSADKHQTKVRLDVQRAMLRGHLFAELDIQGRNTAFQVLRGQTNNANAEHLQKVDEYAGTLIEMMVIAARMAK